MTEILLLATATVIELSLSRYRRFKLQTVLEELNVAIFFI